MTSTYTTAPLGTDQRELASLLRKRDPTAVQEVVSRYLPQVYRAARAAGFDQHGAEDVAQSTFATFIETVPRFEGRSHVRTWIFGILYKKIAEARRAVRRDQDVDDIDDVFDQRFDAAGGWARPPRPADADVYDAETRHQIEDCLDHVPTKQRMAFVLREVEELDSSEICNILNVSRTNLGVLLHRVRNRLRECLETKGVEGPT